MALGIANHDFEEKAVLAGIRNPEDGAVLRERFEQGDTAYAKLQRWAGRFHVEQRGIERVPENERTDKSLLNLATMWISVNMVISSFTIGVIAQRIFFLGFTPAILACVFFNLIAVLPVCWFSTFGSRFGLRQMVLSRFWFGFNGVKIFAVFNVIGGIGWSSINVIVAAGLIHAVNNNVPAWAAILVLALSTLLITFLGYNAVHGYAFWCWIPVCIVFMIVLGTFAHSGDFVDNPTAEGTSELGSILSFGSIVWGGCTGWAALAADYPVYHPATLSRWKIFLVVWLGIMIPLLFTELLGIAVTTASTRNGGSNSYNEGYEASGPGGLLAAVLIPPLGGFGKFCLILLALSTIANNCPNMYSFSFGMQVFGSWTQMIPRFIWNVVGTAAYVAIAVAGYSRFETVLQNFMSFYAYFLAIYEGVAFADHFVYKRSMSAYNPALYDQPLKLPPGYAAIFGFCCGIAGTIIGVSQVWYVGPIALHAGVAPNGGDVGAELAFAFSGVGYTAVRWYEKKYFGR